jgi:aryl-alcohol dehydrogenase-like predicted oxidoreductase
LGGLFVSQIGGGSAQGIATIQHALGRGLNYLDTAAGYLDSEAVIGQALDGFEPSAGSGPLILSTKLGRRVADGKPQPFDPKDKADLRACLETSLRLLRRESVDVLMIHEPDRPREYAWWDNYEDCRGPVVELLDEFKREGKIRFTGLGGTTAYEIVPLMKSGQFDVVLTAFNYSLLWREAEHAIFPTARELNLGIVAGSPLQQGALARRFDAELDSSWWLSPPRRAQFKALYALLDEIGLPIAEVALRFVLSQPVVSTVLMGARSPEEVDANIAATEKGPLSPEILGRLDEIASLVPFRPYEEPFGLPFGHAYGGPGQAGR